MEEAEKQKLSDYFDSIVIEGKPYTCEYVNRFRIDFSDCHIDINVHRRCVIKYKINDNIIVTGMTSDGDSYCTRDRTNQCLQKHVTFVAIYEALNEGYSKIMLYCMDCNQLINANVF